MERRAGKPASRFAQILSCVCGKHTGGEARALDETLGRLDRDRQPVEMKTRGMWPDAEERDQSARIPLLSRGFNIKKHFQNRGRGGSSCLEPDRGREFIG
jgi:hypothetical protein